MPRRERGLVIIFRGAVISSPFTRRGYLPRHRAMRILATCACRLPTQDDAG